MAYSISSNIELDLVIIKMMAFMALRIKKNFLLFEMTREVLVSHLAEVEPASH